MRRILLIGATGVFGARLAAMLAAIDGIELMLAARDMGRLDRLRESLVAAGATAGLSAVTFDRDRPLGLAALAPWLVIDAAGPFQASGYALARAAIEAGAHYIDLADARDFVAGFPAALDATARAANVLAVTGASSTPALSHAALGVLVEGWQRLDDVCVAISPGARAPRGLAVMQAILGYAGQPVRVFRDGGWRQVPGWSGLQRIEMPGLGRRWASICETPDLDLLPQRFPVRRSALFFAGLELAPMHLGLALLSLAVRWRLVGSLRPLAEPLRRIAGVFVPFGTDRGGMIVEASGRDDEDRPIRARWSLCAAANAGPNTPAAPAAALARALFDGRETRRGAFASAGLIGLDDILRELAAFPITTRIDESLPDDPVLFRRLVGRRFEAMPAPVRAVHGGSASRLFRGRAVTRVGRSPSAQLVRFLGLPPSGLCPVEVRLAVDASGETWTRAFGAARFVSRLAATRRLGVFEERIGPLRFVFALEPTPVGVTWELIGWRLGALPLPLKLAPRVRAAGEARRGHYIFRVVVAHAWTGLLFAYRGMLETSS